MAEAASLPDKLFFITFSMVVMGFVTVLEWDALFPDRRDFTILIPLPIRLETIFTAKIVSLCGFVLLFFAASNAISTFVYPFVAWRGDSPFLGVMSNMLTHAKVVLAATSFVFFFFVALQGLLMNVFSFRAFKRVSTYVQLLAVLALLMMILLLLDISTLLQSPSNRHLLYFFPPAWFLGLYETTLLKPDLLPGSSEIAMRALWIVLGASAIAYALSYQRHVKRSLESEDIFDAAPSWISSRLGALADRFLLHSPLEQASFYFTAKTMIRSRKHWLYLAAYVGVGFALVLQGVIAYVSRHPGAAIDRPILALLPAYVFLWGWATALFHTFFDVVLSLLLIELLLLTFRKIPFTCSYLPGKANITALWFVYWLGFATYAYTMASLESWALESALRIVCSYLAGTVLVGVAFYYLNRFLAEGFTFVF